MASAVRGGGDSADGSGDSDMTREAPTAVWMPPGTDGARPSPDSRGKTADSRVQRRRSAELDGKTRRPLSGGGRVSRQRPLSDRRRSGSASDRQDLRTKESSAAPGESRSDTTAPSPDTATAPAPDTATAPAPDTTTAPSPDTKTAPAPDTETEDQLTHRELETVFRDTLSALLAADPLLGDLPASLTADELRSLTALEHGTAMAVLVNRGDRLTRVIVQRAATVRDLKAALRGAVELELLRRGGRRRAVSWRYVWRAHWLSFKGRRLTDDNASLTELGIANKAEVCFVKRIRAKRGQRDKKGGQV